jgi:hypothetical protein
VLTTSLCGEDADFGGITQLPPGADANHYLLWVFTIGSGNNVTSATLNTNGDTTTWPTDPWTTSTGNTIKFITKAYDLSTLTAFVTWVGDLGSGNHNLVISHGCAGKAQPELTTTASGAGFTGDALGDTAHLTGGSNPTGTITFTLYGPNDSTCSTPIYSEDVTVDNGNDDYSTNGSGSPTGGNIAPSAGTYQWIASYSGDDNNEAAGPTACDDPAEASVVEAAVPDVETELHAPDHSVIANGTALDLGSTVHDSGTVTGPSALGTPDGHVDFVFYNEADCGGDGTAAGTIDPLADGDTAGVGVAHPSTEEGPLAPGSYGFKAFFYSDNTAVWQNNQSECEPFTVNKGQLDATTILHDADHGVIHNGDALDLGSVVHDTAQITGQVQGFNQTGAVTFAFYSGENCAGDPVAVDNVGPDEVSNDPRSDATDPLAHGSYGFKATVAEDDNYLGDTSDCEPFTVNKGDLTITTYIHDSQHNVVTSVPVNGIVHDTATLGGAVSGFVPTADNVSFTFYNTIDCTGTGTSEANIGPDSLTGDPRSEDVGPLASGAYSFQASFANDANYNDAGPSACEPLSVRTFGKTMGYWGNTNGQARIPSTFTYTLGISGLCYINVTKSPTNNTLTILPHGSAGLNGVSILTNCTTTASRDTGINVNSLNTLLAQALALKLNINLISGFDGQTLAAMGLTASIPTVFPTGQSLTGSSTVQQVLDYANYLIGHSKAGDGFTITQTMIGQLNTLLGLINAEA